jgi:hypothetical protein
MSMPKIQERTANPKGLHFSANSMRYPRKRSNRSMLEMEMPDLLRQVDVIDPSNPVK